MYDLWTDIYKIKQYCPSIHHINNVGLNTIMIQSRESPHHYDSVTRFSSPLRIHSRESTHHYDSVTGVS